MSPANVTLRTGAEVPGPVAGTVTIALERLLDVHPVALYEAVCIARDKAHVPFGNTGAALEDIGLLQQGVMHDATRDVILAATDGDGGALRLVSPYAAEAGTR
jgi:hypothetical protein